MIVNEISQLPLDAVLPDWADSVSEPKLLFHGGPVSPNGAICLASVKSSEEEPPGWRPLFDNIGLLHLDTPIEIVTAATATCGYSPATGGPLGSCSPRLPKGCGMS